MSNVPRSEALISPAAARNRGPILAVLKPRLPNSGIVLEIASGPGEHAVYLAAALPHLQWQPTDPDPDALVSIAAWRDHAALPNLLPALHLDASDPNTWPAHRIAAVVNINMTHIAPWAATQGLLAGAGRLLPRDGVLFLYGPYIDPDVETAPTNMAFDRALRDRNPAWGLRRLDDMIALASEHRMVLSERITMPANNLALFFRKS